MNTAIPPAGVSLEDHIENSKMIIADGIVLQTIAVMAALYGKDEALWMAHICNVHVMDTEWDHYSFYPMPDPLMKSSTPWSHNIMVVDKRSNETVGYVEALVNQPLFKKYLEE